MSGCRVARLPSCKVAGLSSCRVAELPGSRVAELPSCRVADICMLSVTFTVLSVYARNVFAVLTLAFC